MEFHVRKENGVAVVKVSGRLDTVTAPEFEESIRTLVGVGDVSFVLEVGDLDYISSAGLRALLLMSRLVKEEGGSVCLANVTAGVRSVLEMCKLEALFPMASSVPEAIAALAK